ncbi:type III secretion system effector PipB2, partial [Salmonella enterica subsp. enterica]|nr:type III secretion system effector PipB2 [Salmonella enterica subsp. enterica]
MQIYMINFIMHCVAVSGRKYMERSLDSLAGMAKSA